MCAVNVGTLFRGSDAVSSLLAKMARLMGQDYLMSSVAPLVEMVLRHSFNRRLEARRHHPMCACVVCHLVVCRLFVCTRCVFALAVALTRVADHPREHGGGPTAAQARHSACGCVPE